MEFFCSAALKIDLERINFSFHFKNSWRRPGSLTLESLETAIFKFLSFTVSQLTFIFCI